MKSGKRNSGKRKRSMKTSAWQQSTEFRLMARAAISRFNKTRPLLPKCGAQAKSTGEPCRQPAMENGRCYVHGGRTPRGAGWHLPVWPDKSAPNAMTKLNGKLIKRERYYQARERKLAAMTPAERSEHDRWQKAHKPGSPAKRAATREEKRQNKAAKLVLQGWKEKSAKSYSTAAATASASHASLRTGDEAPTIPDWPNQGVFG